MDNKKMLKLTSNFGNTKKEKWDTISCPSDWQEWTMLSAVEKVEQL